MATEHLRGMPTSVSFEYLQKYFLKKGIALTAPQADKFDPTNHIDGVYASFELKGETVRRFIVALTYGELFDQLQKIEAEMRVDALGERQVELIDLLKKFPLREILSTHCCNNGFNLTEIDVLQWTKGLTGSARLALIKGLMEQMEWKSQE